MEMMSAKLFLALLFVVLLRYDVNGSELELSQQRRQYDYFILSLHWPNTYCMQPGIRCRRSLPQRFTLHGLWPQRFDGTTMPCFPASIANRVFNRFRTDLLNYWPDLTTTSFEGSKPFWQREYSKHGTCCTEKFNAEEYVERSLRLTQIHDVREYLRVARIVPNNQQYAPRNILAAIRARTGFEADIQCVTVNRRVYLLEVRICINHNGRVVNDCRGRAIGCPANQNPYFPASVSSIIDQMDEDVDLGAEMKGENNTTEVMDWKLEDNDEREDGSSSI